MKKLLLVAIAILCSTISHAQNTMSNSTAGGDSVIGGIGQEVILTSIQISPPNPAIPFNQAQAFTALGIFNNGSTGNLTGVATWLSSNPSIATNSGSGPNFQCVTRGIVTIMAIYEGIQGTTTLTCESPTFSPQGTITTTQSVASITIVQFTAANGTAPFSFSSSDLPSFLSLSSAGCSPSQVFCSLIGAPATLGIFNFHIQATDDIGNQACVPPGCPVSLNVVSPGSEDNIYCSSSGAPNYTETVTGLTDEAQSIIGIQMLQACNNTAIINSPNAVGQTSSNTDDSTTGWTAGCVTPCAGSGNPPVAYQGDGGHPGAILINQQPSLDGDAGSVFETSATGGFSDALWVFKQGPNDAAISQSYDIEVYPTPGWSELEYDTFNFCQSCTTFHGTGEEYMYGSQCKAGHNWQIWNESAGSWNDISPAVSCNITSNAWNHIQWFVHRNAADVTGACSGEPCMYYDRLIVNGTTLCNPCGQYPAGSNPAGFHNTGYQIQIDIASANTTVTENFDEASFTANTQTGQTINVCPRGELSNGVSVPGCAALPAPPLTPHNPNINCNTTGGRVYCETIQDALDTIGASGTPCGNTIELYGTIDDLNPASAQNIYTENVTTSENILCGPDHSQPWNWITNTQFYKLPPPGNRITPAWVGQVSVIGRQNYSQTTDYGVPSGTYLPMWRCRQLSPGGCPGFDTGTGGTVPTIMDGLRVMGIMFGAPHGRNAQIDLYGNHICNSNGDSTSNQWQCSPGYIGQNVSAGCDQAGNGSNAINCDNSTSGFFGSQHVIFDRDIFLGCDNPAVISSPPTSSDCYDTAQTGILAQGGRHISIIESYLYQITCLYGIGGCVDSHAIASGNPPSSNPTTGNDVSFKLLDDYIEATGENFFLGGGNATAGVIPTDYEIRRNDAWKPLTWLAVPLGGVNLFPGVLYDAFIPNGRFGSGYHLGTTCSVDPPLSGTQAQCTPVLALDSSGITYEIVDVLVCPTAPCSSSSPAGSGYGVQDKANGNTAVSQPNFYFTDSGTTYSSCANQLGGNVTSQIVSGQQEILWAHGNKFISGLVGTNIGICGTQNACTYNNATQYTVTSFVNNKTIVIGTTLTTQLNNNAYVSDLPSRGDCVQPSIALFNVKNPGEYKNGVRILHEGNVSTNDWNGQSDQDGSAFLITPKNANNGEPSAEVTDLVERYNLYHNMVKGMTIGIAAATRGATLPLSISRVSVHDIAMDGMNAYYWSSGSSPVSTGGGLCVSIVNSNGPATAVNNVYANHITCVGTLPNGQTQSGGAALGLNFGQFIKNGTLPAVLQNIYFQNSIAAGGVRNTSQQTQGLSGCNSQACGFTHGPNTYGPTESAMRQVLSSDWTDPVSGADYTGNIVQGLALSNGTVNTDNAGNMTSPSGLTFPGPYSATPVTCPGSYPALSSMICTLVYIQGVGYSSVTAVSSATAAVISPAAGNNTGIVWAGGGLAGIVGSCNPSACSISAPTGGSCASGFCPATCVPVTSAGAITQLKLKDPGSGYTAIPTVSFSGGTCGSGGAPQAIALIGGAGNLKTSAACFDHNAIPTAAWAGELSMSPYPEHQIDAVNNACASPAGGHINTDTSGNPITVDTWDKVKFVGFDGKTVGVDANAAECNGNTASAGSNITPCQPPDLHLSPLSPFHNAGNDGLDFGANMDLVLGTESGTPSQYTQCFVSANTYQCPR